MDFLDFFENMGLGLGIVVVLIVVVFLILLMSALIPALLVRLAGLLYIIIILLAVGAIIYFIGKFAKDFIKK